MQGNSNSLLFRHITKYFLPQIDEGALIYHYTSPLGLKSILEHRELWASDFAFLNDKSENRYLYDILKLTIEDKRLSSKIDSEFLIELNKILNHRMDEIPNNYYRYICSFSSNRDSLSLWNYYTKTATGTGYNIGFKWKNLIENFELTEEQEIKCGKVVYDRNEQVRILEMMVIGYNCDFATASSEEDRIRVLSELKSCLDILSAYIKHPAFMNEEEVRVCITQKITSAMPRKAKYRESNGIMIPFLSINFLSDAVKSISISPTSVKEISEYGLSGMLMDLGYSGVSVKASEIPLRN
ncbi:MAG: DUF2971 domain-containing protein [Pseudoflavonifractor capillosus]|nr:DUF2971 domain-containing protein [Pseudoflavonifractor capillosus]